jgi:hypothetical protein
MWAGGLGWGTGEDINMKLSTTVVIYVFAHASNKTRKTKQKKNVVRKQLFEARVKVLRSRNQFCNTLLRQ